MVSGIFFVGETQQIAIVPHDNLGGVGAAGSGAVAARGCGGALAANVDSD